ncbi:hypothetical protein ATE92_0213 [Ulvibacter sp. MAR_2010_11]|uniref:DUF5694 domain-containing protein n=1 Tax=Ulvibacter sp. MAR_2010_11 TaxID=1250229 RepID=UPI000CC2E3A1|nr:DUF5694 domain-containing protein [Ulvibacter sp. MAR_2010_11]PKA82088.1 hypothetical protein ATE92_0213 [Ulvibacter sp. MAR_2010_11]
MKKHILVMITIGLFACSDKKYAPSDSRNSEPEVNKTYEFKSPSSFFPKEKAQVLVVGTFHFDYPGLDAYKTAEENKMAILSTERQKQVRELVDYIKRFKPTKIAVESPASYAQKENDELKAYKNGDLKLGRSEGHQLTMRIAKEMNLDTIYAIDANAFTDDIAERDSIFAKALWKDYDWQSDDPVQKYFMDWLGYEDVAIKNSSLLEYFKHMNSRESHQYGYGAYLVGDFDLGEYQGADVLAAYWYNRNLRIFRNLKRITDGPDDRIVLIFGNGHAAILRQLIEASPEYEFVEFDSL